MRNILTIILILSSFILFSQNEQSIEFSLYGSVPSDFNKQYRQDEFQPKVVDPTYPGGCAGYDLYNTLGSGFITEYTNKFSKRFAYKLGLDFILHTNYKEAYDKNLAMASSYIREPLYGSEESYYKSTNYEYYLGFLLGGKYYFGKRSSLFLYVSLNYITFSYHNRINWLNEEIKFWESDKLSDFYSYVFYKVGYNYQFSDKLSSFVLIELNSDIYFGLGVKYKLKLK